MENCWAQPWIGPRNNNSSHRRNNWTVSSEFGGYDLLSSTRNLKQKCRGCVYLLWSKLKSLTTNNEAVDLTPVVPFQHTVSVLSTCRPSSHGAVVLTKQEVAASRVEIKKKKRPLHSHGTFWPGFDERALQALAQTLWKNASRQSSAFFHLICSVTEHTPTVRRTKQAKGRRSLDVPATRRGKWEAERENGFRFRTAERSGVSDLTRAFRMSVSGSVLKR